MLYRLVRPMKRSGSSIPQFVQRIPADVRPRAIGRTLTIPLSGNTSAAVKITAKTDTVRFSLRSRDPAEVKIRQGHAAAQLETIWQGLRSTEPVFLTNRDAHALAGDLYRAWADGSRERDLTATYQPEGRTWLIERPNEIPPEEAEQGFAAATHRLTEAAENDGLEAALGPIVDPLLLAKGIAEVDPGCRPVLLSAFLLALRDAFEHRKRNAAGDFTPDPKAARFPEWTSQEAKAQPPRSAKVTLTGLVDAWWHEAKAAGRKPSTYESYRNTVVGLVTLLGHDDATRVTPEDVIRFKDHRLASVHPRTGKPISAKTVKDSDLSGLKTLFGWAVVNRMLSVNPATGITIKLGKPVKLRSKGLTDAEARAILTAASEVVRGGERPETAAGKRWVPWLCAYTGARVGELAQLRKQDLRQEGEHWVITITPEAGTVKTNEAREVVLHSHLVEQGYPQFVASAAPGHLFLRPAKNGDVLGPLQGVKNRLQEFVRAIVTDRNVAPNHGWRHRFKTVGMEAGIPPRILDAIQGQAAVSIADQYGDVTLNTMADAMAKFPRITLMETTGIGCGSNE
jgi:integrase